MLLFEFESIIVDSVKFKDDVLLLVINEWFVDKFENSKVFGLFVGFVGFVYFINYFVLGGGFNFNIVNMLFFFFVIVFYGILCNVLYSL